MIGVCNVNTLEFDAFERDREFQKIEGREPSNLPFISINNNKQNPNDFDCIVLSDQFIPQVDNLNSKLKIAHLEEPYCFTHQYYNYVMQNIDKFDLVFTHHEEFVGIHEKIKYYPFGAVSIKREDFDVYPKNKHCSIIASQKNFLHGHSLRHEVIKKLDPEVYTIKQGEPFEYKLKYLKDYRFSIVIENSKRDYYFTEKIIDCFKTGTVPIYWGCPSIGDYFDETGIITWSTMEELMSILENLSEKDYTDRLDAINANFHEANKYFYQFEWMWENGIKELYGGLK